LRGLALENRIMVSPMCQYSAVNGSMTDWHLAHLGMLANSGAALLCFEMTDVEPIGRITPGCSGLYSDANEAALARIVAHCREHGQAKLAIQLAHAGRKASTAAPWDARKSLGPEEGDGSLSHRRRFPWATANWSRAPLPAPRSRRSWRDSRIRRVVQSG